MRIVRIALLTGTALVFSGSAIAQNPLDPLAELRQKNRLSDEEKATIADWVSQKVRDAVSSEPQAAMAAGRDLRGQSGATPEFAEVYSRNVIESVRTALKRASLEGSARLLASVLGSLASADAALLAVDALTDDRAAVRAAAAAALRRLQGPIALVSGDYFTKTLNGLRDAAKKETSRRALEAMYRAMDYSGIQSQPDAPGVARALLEVLEARAAQYRQAEVPAEGAEVVALKVATRYQSNLDRDRLVDVTATILRHAVANYAGSAGVDKPLRAVRDKDSPALVARRNALEQLILVAESLLNSILKPQAAPTISAAMKDADTTNMKIQYLKWADVLQKVVNKDYRLDLGPG